MGFMATRYLGCFTLCARQNEGQWVLDECVRTRPTNSIFALEPCAAPRFSFKNAALVVLLVAVAARAAEGGLVVAGR